MDELAAEQGVKVRYEVNFVSTGSFDLTVKLLEPGPAREKTFDLSAGITPRIRRAVRRWFVPGSDPERAVPAAPVVENHRTKVRYRVHAFAAR
jgi:hypothetical protein